MKTNMLDYFEKTVLRKPDKIAVIDGERTTTFRKLADKALGLGTRIIKKNDHVLNHPIGVFIEKSIESIYADIGILYSGNAYMNLDIKSPVQRIANIIELIQPAYIITTGKYVAKLQEIYESSRIINLDETDLSSFSQMQLMSRLDRLIDTDPLCLINTSGSTGTPKGVILNHRSFIDFTEWANQTTGIDENEVVGSLSPIVFDIYSFELCMLMSKSSTILVIPENFSAFPAKILMLMQDKDVTFIFWVPTIMVNIANMDLLGKVPLSTLKMVWFAGEVFPTKQFKLWRRALPDTRFINLYGPIEITLDCTYYIIDRNLSDDEPIPIGFPCKNTDILLLNEDNQLCSHGEEGELCVRGTSLAMGYYNNPEKTASAFVQNPLNSSYPEVIYRTGDIVSVNEYGEIIFKGRRDTLVKHSGYRIELTEIEHVVVNKLRIVKNGCIVYDHQKKNIVLFFEPNENLSVSEMKKRIGEILPRYMMPTVFIQIKQLPRNANGKIDRLKLKESL